MKRTPLRGLDQINWSVLNHAYGPATDVPDLLHALVSPDKETRNHAWYELHGNLWHQGTIYEATSCVVPFLIQLLQAPQVRDKADILAYLATIFNGQGFWEVHGALQWLDRPPEAELEESLTLERSWVERTKSEIRRRKRTYFRLLRQGDQRTSIAAAYLLGLIGDTRVEIVEEILQKQE